MRVMGDWLLALPLPWMTLVIFSRWQRPSCKALV
jgi:hypothetical protein